MYESPSEKLIGELANRKYTVNVLALLLQDMELFEPLSTILQPGYFSKKFNPLNRLQINDVHRINYSC
jgi:hypothetical protein